MEDPLQKQMQSELEKLKAAQNDFQKSVQARQQLDGQLTENQMVKEELEKASDDSKIFKLIGPALIPQDLREAKQTVTKRIEYISTEMKRYDGLISASEKKVDFQKNTLSTLQRQLQQAAATQAKAATGGGSGVKS